MHSYTYSVLRYLHDPSVGEAINVGVLVYAPEEDFVRIKCEHRTKALSGLFGGFQRDEFIRFLHRLEASVEGLQYSLNQARNGLFGEEMKTKKPEDVAALAKWLIADNNLSFQFGPAKGGLTRDLLSVTQTVFERQILSQRPATKNYKRRDEEAVWSVFQTALREKGITKHLAPQIIQTPAFELPFKYAYENERWHAVEPLSFDYANPDEIRILANLWYSYGAALKESDNFAQLYLLLGPPTKAEYIPAYEKAKRWLAKMPIHAQLVEENEAEEFAEQLASTMKREGVLVDSDVIEPTQ